MGKSLNINYLSSLKVLNLLLKKNRSNKNRGVLFFAGGGTNNAVSYYSAYTLSKILLIKFVELFDFEEKNKHMYTRTGLDQHKNT